MKTYVITLSEKFPTTHPRKGQETEFGRSFLNGKKIHTIRGNFPLWEKRLKEVQEGRAVLSVRQWTGVPYRSPQKELRRLTKEDGVRDWEQWHGAHLQAAAGQCPYTGRCPIYARTAKNRPIQLSLF